MPPANRSSDTTCLYTILGLERGVSETDIKKAYRRLALKWHPDKHTEQNKEEAEKRFKEISAAYDILSDAEKRRVYDKYGLAGLRGSPSHPDTTPRSSTRCSVHSVFDNDDFFNFAFRDPEEIFREFFSEHIDMMNSFMEPFTMNLGGVRRAESSRAESTNSCSSHPVRRARTHLPDRSGSRIFSSFLSSSNSLISPKGGVSQSFAFFSSSPNVTASIHQSGTKLTFSGGNGGGRSTVPVKGTFRSTSTKFLGGKCVTTRRVIQDGVETVTVEEDGVVKSKTVNGQQVAILSA